MKRRMTAAAAMALALAAGLPANAQDAALKAAVEADYEANLAPLFDCFTAIPNCPAEKSTPPPGWRRSFGRSAMTSPPASAATAWSRCCATATARR